MHGFTYTIPLTLVVTAVLSTAGAAHAAPPIDLEVAVAKSSAFGSMQEWGRVLNEIGLTNVRLRGAAPGDKPSVTPVGSGGAQRFRVLAIVNVRDQLVVPGAAFSIHDAAAIKQYFEGLPRQVAEQGVERGIFGLTLPQFQTIYEDLSTPVAATTGGVALDSVVQSVSAQLTTPIHIDARARNLLDDARPVEADLKGLSAGTALAIALRPAGLELRPLGPSLDTVALQIVPATRDADHWPTGWKPEGVGRQVSPQMYQFTTIEISGFTLEQALNGGLAPHMGIPLIYDHRILAERQIDPAKIQVKFPRSKTYIRRAVDNVLSQASLAGELRVDEAGKGFYWITQFGPDSPRAIGAEPPEEGPGARDGMK